MSVTAWELGGVAMSTGGGANVRVSGRPLRRSETDMVDGTVFELEFAASDLRFDQPLIFECDFGLLPIDEYVKFKLWYDMRTTFTLETGLYDAVKAACVCPDTSYTTYYGPCRPWKSGSVAVYVDDALVDPADYTLSLTAGTITFDTPLIITNVVTVTYIHYPVMKFTEFQGTLDTPSTYAVLVQMKEVRA